MRDEFSKPEKEALAKRVNGCCSNPGCQRPTFGPRVELHGAVNIGVAAHITAASSGGPRFSGSLTNEQRSHISNGIWLCQSCAKLIDSDESRYTTDVLFGWKSVAEQEAHLRLVNIWGSDRQHPFETDAIIIQGMSNQETPAMAYLEFARLENITAKWEDTDAIFDACRIMTDGGGKRICWEVVALDNQTVVDIDSYFEKFLGLTDQKCRHQEIDHHFISIVAHGGHSGENEQLAETIFEYCTSCSGKNAIRVLIGFMARIRYVDLVFTGA